MLRWVVALIAAIVAGIFIITISLLIVLIRRRRFVSEQRLTITQHHHHQHDQPTTITTEAKTMTGLATKSRPSYQLLGRGSSTKSYFNWADHPALITDAVENGWSRFAFSSYAPFPSVRSSLFSSLRATGDYSNGEVEESWEIGAESVDFMQKLQFKIKVNNNNNGVSNYSTVRMALPLPGPPAPLVDASSFPQEAYFEITVLNSSEDNGKVSGGEGEKTKLLISSSSSTSTSTSRVEALFHVSSSRGSHLLEELKIGGRGFGAGAGGGGVKVSIGLTDGGLMTSRIPGSYPASIGFNSDGSVFLGGMKLVFESEKEDWAKTGKVIGCGFDPKKKKVYFTVDSELVHVIHCKSEDFGMPLYPVIATNIDITVMVNLGQANFIYSPSNAHRTPNPCFIGPVVNSTAPALGYEDSRELFSMGRIDTDWLSHSATITSTVSNASDYYGVNIRNNKVAEFEEEFFEIVLDSTR